jgi:hypothetical protein
MTMMQNTMAAVDTMNVASFQIVITGGDSVVVLVDAFVDAFVDITSPILDKSINKIKSYKTQKPY